MSETLFYPLIISRAAIGCAAGTWDGAARRRLAERGEEKSGSHVGLESFRHLGAISFYSAAAIEQRKSTNSAITFPYKYANTGRRRGGSYADGERECIDPRGEGKPRVRKKKKKKKLRSKERRVPCRMDACSTRIAARKKLFLRLTCFSRTTSLILFFFITAPFTLVAVKDFVHFELTL